MTQTANFQIEIGAEMDRYFDDSSLSNGAEPRIVILMGGPAAGKTTIRKQHYSTGYVLVDAAEIFLNLSRGEYFDFPGPFDEMLAVMGPLIARRAITERRHIVTELIGSEFETTKALIEAMRAIGYRVEMHAITCDLEEAQRRNLSRGDDNISAYYAEHYQRDWLHEAALAALNPE
jgi:chloramphenicol 3-O-phosphotransferase